MEQRPDGLTVVFTKLCRYGWPGEIKTLAYTTADRLCISGFAARVTGQHAVFQGVPAPIVDTPVGAKTFVLVSMKNGCGLQVDYEILQQLLEAAGHKVYVELAHSIVAPNFRHVDVVVFLEIIDPRWFTYAPEFWAVPNSEWWRADWNQYVPKLSKILCKTQDCFDIWNKIAPGRCAFIGFESKDFYKPEIVRTKSFFHLAGGSCNKGTAHVLQAWKDYHIPFPLVVVSNNYQGLTAHLRNVPNVMIYNRLPDLTQFLNGSQFHILPSRYEGWGHALHEGLGCGAVVLTTDAAPMSEATGLPKALLIPVAKTSHQRVLDYLPGGESMTNMYDVSPESIYQKVTEAAALSDDSIKEISAAARAGFLKDRESFRANIASLIATKPAPIVVAGAPRDIVLVTTFFRPEYLWTCLNAIAEAEGGAEKEVWVAQDHHTDPMRADVNFSQQAQENAEIVAHFRDKFAAFRFIDRAPMSYDGNSYNCLELYKDAYGTNARFVYLVEDDIVVEKDFFRWHEAVQQKGDYLCSVGRLQTERTDLLRSDDPSKYVESASDYTSWGTCWRREKLAPLVEHACDLYYRNMTGYIMRRFPNSALGSVWTEQDGLIRRVMLEGAGTRLTASPCLKRAYHIGITGYHRSNGFKFTGTLTEKVQQLATALRTGAIAGMRKDFIDLNDIDTPRGSTPPWSELEAVQRLS